MDKWDILRFSQTSNATKTKTNKKEFNESKKYELAPL
jgi:hypothetical protein